MSLLIVDHWFSKGINKKAVNEVLKTKFKKQTSYVLSGYCSVNEEAYNNNTIETLSSPFLCIGLAVGLSND